MWKERGGLGATFARLIQQTSFARNRSCLHHMVNRLVRKGAIRPTANEAEYILEARNMKECKLVYFLVPFFVLPDF